MTTEDSTDSGIALAFKDIDYMERLRLLSPEDLSCFIHDLYYYSYYWIGDPTAATIEELIRRFPLLNEFLEFDLVRGRLGILDKFKKGSFGVHITKFVPELETILKSANSLFEDVPIGLNKAELWLLPIARQADADSEIEASIYFASRGKNVFDTDGIKERWHKTICYDIVHHLGNRVTPESLERALNGTISLAEASQILSRAESLGRFFGFGDLEEDFIDASMFRAVEHLGITGFQSWLDALLSELSLGPQYGVDHIPAGFWLFHWCRSDLAIRMADRQGLEGWLWGLINGQVDRERPWRVLATEPRYADYVSLAGVILFAWHRIKPANMNPAILDRATNLLYETQLACGGWPVTSDSAEANLLTTCLAMHGLALHQPDQWQQVLSRGAEWLLSQQESDGAWRISGGPTVMLTVLALDSLALARGEENLTFRYRSLAHVEEDDPVYDVSGQEWHDPPAPTMTPIALTEAQAIAHPRLAIVVATETELRQVLRVVTPLSEQSTVLKVSEYDTFYLGTFGAYQTVITLSTMGPLGPGGATLTTAATIQLWNPTVVLMIGIAFGANRSKQNPADVLVTEHLVPYEHQRVGKKLIFRNSIPPSSAPLVDRFRNSLDWRFNRPDGTLCGKHVGQVLSGEKLIDSQPFKDVLLQQFPTAIGGEMEGAGLYAACVRANKPWILVKGVCDWGDGKKNDTYHEMAAASAVSLCKHVFSDPHTLDGIY